VIWTERAEADLDEIWRFSRRKWGEEQADLYLAKLNADMADGRRRKLHARAIDFVSPGWFRMRVVRHIIYFCDMDQQILVMRVLHDSMDETLHLP
jgi:toxin ParE1/3/4